MAVVNLVKVAGVPLRRRCWPGRGGRTPRLGVTLACSSLCPGASRSWSSLVPTLTCGPLCLVTAGHGQGGVVSPLCSHIQKCSKCCYRSHRDPDICCRAQFPVPPGKSGCWDAQASSPNRQAALLDTLNPPLERSLRKILVAEFCLSQQNNPERKPSRHHGELACPSQQPLLPGELGIGLSNIYQGHDEICKRT